MCRHLQPNRAEICLEKYLNLPYLKFFTSKMTWPERIKLNHEFSFPFPFPIRDPTTFLVRGKWGKALNQSFLLVLSDLRELFFSSKLNLNIFCAVSNKFLVTTKPCVPKFRFFGFNFALITLRFLNTFLWSNFLGLNNI